jgi:tape measure domain-containing protein
MAEIKVTADTREAERSIRGLTSGLQGLASIAVGAGLTQQFITITSQVQELNNKLIFATGGVDEANKAFGLLAQTAQATGSSLAGTTDLFSKLAQSATFAGSSQEVFAKITENFNKTLQISGASGAGAASALYQFAQAIQKGTLNGDEFRTIMETNGYLLQVLEKQTGKTRSELIQMASQGRLSAEIVGKALLTATGISEDYAKTTRTIPQALENLSTSVAVAVNNFNKMTGAGDALVKVLDWFSKNTGALIGGIGGVAIAVTILTANLIGLRTALISTGVGALVVGIGIALGFAAEKLGLFGDVQKDVETNTAKTVEQLKKEQEELLKGLKVTPQKSTQQLDYAKKIGETIRALKAENDVLSQGTGIRSLQLEVEKAIAAEKEKAKAAGASLSAQQQKDLGRETGRRVLIEEENTIKKDLLSLSSQTLTTSIADAGQRAIAVELERYRLSLTRESYDLKKSELEQAIQSNLQAQALRTVSDDTLRTQAEFNSILIVDKKLREETLAVELARLQYGKNFTAEIERQVRATANLKNLQTQIAAGISLASGNSEASLRRQLNDELNNLEAARRAGDLVNEEAYLTTKAELQLKYYNNIRDLREKQYAEEFRQGGFSNKKAAEMAKQRNDVEKMTKEEQIQFGAETYGKMLSDLGTFNKDAFKAAKAFNIAVAIMDTYKAAQGAFTSLVGIPIIGPALGAVAAGAAIAAGMARVSAIRSQSFSGRALGGPVMGNDSYIVGENGPEVFTPNTTGSITRNSDIGGGDNVNINFNINTVDSKGFDTLLATRKPMIIQMVRTAMNDRGNRSLV